MSHEAANINTPSQQERHHPRSRASFEIPRTSLEPTASSTRPQPTHSWEQIAAPQHASAPYLEHNGIASARASSDHDELDSLTSAHNSGCRS